MKQFDYDIIVVGSGMTGGIAAKEFCEKGYKTLVLDRGRALTHRQYKTEGKAPWDMEFRGRVTEKEKAENWPINGSCYLFSDYNKAYFLKDNEMPYQQQKPFTWFRSDVVGGKSLLWGRQSYRWNKMDFEANGKDGYGLDWPIRYEDVEQWYNYIEPFIGISGSFENLPQLPDGQFLPAQPLNIAERQVKEKIEKTFPARKLIPARVAHLTKPQLQHTKLGRGQCQARSECDRGCSWGGYYSSLSGGLAAAEVTGNMTLTANAMVQEVIYDENTQQASGVRYLDRESKQEIKVTAKLVFMCASALSSVQILLNSKSKRFPNGIANDSKSLGHYITDHIGGLGAGGIIPGNLDMYYKGRRPGGIYIPRFKNLNDDEKNTYVRGFGYQGGAGRGGWGNAGHREGIGAEFKHSIRQPGEWWFGLWGFGEMLPRYENRVYLHASEKDQWGMPTLVIDVKHSENEKQMAKDMERCARETLEAAGAKYINTQNHGSKPGEMIHEMGGACMGKDPSTSYLNKWNQTHAVNNLFVTDGAAFPSQSCVNPSITFMALTARAVDYADKQLKTGKI